VGASGAWISGLILVGLRRAARGSCGMRACFAPVALGLAVTEDLLDSIVLRRHHAMGEDIVCIAGGR
jgi:hypothetical protein